MGSLVRVGGSRRTRQRARRSEDRGAVAIEFALIVPIMAVLLFGIIDFGATYANWLAVRDASREGARQAVVGETGGDTSCPTVGTGLISTSTLELICLTKDSAGLTASDVRVKVLVGTYVPGERLSICVQYPADSLSGMFSPLLDDKVVRSKVQMRIEEVATPAIGPVQETAHAGSDWAWCTP